MVAQGSGGGELASCAASTRRRDFVSVLISIPSELGRRFANHRSKGAIERRRGTESAGFRDVSGCPFGANQQSSSLGDLSSLDCGRKFFPARLMEYLAHVRAGQSETTCERGRARTLSRDKA